MSDLIERQAAIDALRKYINVNKNPNHDARIWEEGMNCALTVIGALPSAQPEPLVKESRTLVNDLVNDTISRQAAIDSIKFYYKSVNWAEEYKDIIEVITNDYIEMIDKLPSAQPEQQWIPCSERLPEANGRYLVTRGLNACGAMWNRVYIINYSDLMGLKSERIWWDGNVGKSDFERIDDVIAWMSLPEPYRAERRSDGV